MPAWSYGLWLSTSFTTDYDEATVSSFIDGMAERDLPLSVFHFDCFWMREFNWCDFEWDPRVFPDPTGMLARLHEKDLHVCVWINPYIGQRSPLFAEAKAGGYLVTKPNGEVWQWDLWQAGMGLVDFTNPDATAWYQGKLRTLIDQGVDAFKTDFGERIPLEVDYFDGSSPERMHNYYTQLYNQAVFEVLRGGSRRRRRRAVRAVGDGRRPVDARALGRGLHLHATSRWPRRCAAGSRSPSAASASGATTSAASRARRMPASSSAGPPSACSRATAASTAPARYRVPWVFDEEAVDVTRIFTKLKLSLMPYLYQLGLEASVTGAPLLRPMQLEFADDPAVGYLDRQYLLGPDLLVAPVFAQTARSSSTCRPAPGRTSSRAASSRADAGCASTTASTRCRSMCARAPCSRSARAPTARTTTTSTG